ncbi:MAG: hypothetical protein MR629_01690 [Helicobacter sp.]|uniref:tetratricopeptide repeat protein n=1 Tax=Helicobacter sp. 10-6591 TaxID=2004998 RepID=UPI000DCF0DC4|nr:hypothetical protein [Helicobacter sp. 10-6591]MCI6217243.1 hypothetical protein [Helicobacter sp.]MCI7485845.1 hypothetical protein [Helicobacter sp.]MDD7566789.1 hypothetical protein [Helicobacter sp.]MDY5740317.1 hypothetical protein [Helicobacter sp.]RAX55603.1 hypothetical protein CCY97_03255 [Helicobacter sp. 10-6591]
MSSIRTITLATIYENQGLKDDALQIYEYILNNNPENEEARLGVERLTTQRRMLSQAKSIKSSPQSTESQNIQKPQTRHIITPANPRTKTKWLHVFCALDSQDNSIRFQQWLMEWN